MTVYPRAITQLRLCAAVSVFLYLLLSAISIPQASAAVNTPLDKFLQSHLASESGQTQPHVFWITKELREQAEQVLGHRFPALRVRYWGEDNKTLWVLDEIGKEMPITIGLVVEGGKLADVSILEYRETRGGEVQYPFFTRQFQGLSLDSGDDYSLNGSIDGITGATLSVAAVRKVAILALLFHRHTPFSQNAEHENIVNNP